MTPKPLGIAQSKTHYIRIKRCISVVILVAFLSTSIKAPAYAQVAGESPAPWMPKPGVRVELSPEFTPAHLKGMVIHPENAMQFDFIIHRGDDPLNDKQKAKEYQKLIKYFLASLAVPDENQWVNLSPYEKDRIVKDDFGKTEMGRDLLAQDYILKQMTASLIYPESNLGQKFWDKVYTQAQEQFGTNNIPVNTFNKVWIVPDEAYIYEQGNTVYIVKEHLKVMLEQDYLSLDKHAGITSAVPQQNKDVNQLGSQIVRDVVLPALEKEVNEGKNFATLRQVYSGMLLAAWYKRTLKESLLGKIYADRSKVKGVDQDPKNNEEIYQQYLKAFKKGVFNYIKEDVDKYTNETIPRKYFSGGATSGFVKPVLDDKGMIALDKNGKPLYKDSFREIVLPATPDMIFGIRNNASDVEEVSGNFWGSNENQRGIIPTWDVSGNGIVKIRDNTAAAQARTELKASFDNLKSVMNLDLSRPFQEILNKLQDLNTKVSDSDLAKWDRIIRGTFSSVPKRRNNYEEAARGELAWQALKDHLASGNQAMTAVGRLKDISSVMTESGFVNLSAVIKNFLARNRSNKTIIFSFDNNLESSLKGGNGYGEIVYGHDQNEGKIFVTLYPDVDVFNLLASIEGNLGIRELSKNAEWMRMQYIPVDSWNTHIFRLPEVRSEKADSVMTQEGFESFKKSIEQLSGEHGARIKVVHGELSEFPNRRDGYIVKMGSDGIEVTVLPNVSIGMLMFTLGNYFERTDLIKSAGWDKIGKTGIEDWNNGRFSMDSKAMTTALTSEEQIVLERLKEEKAFTPESSAKINIGPATFRRIGIVQVEKLQPGDYFLHEGEICIAISVSMSSESEGGVVRYKSKQKESGVGWGFSDRNIESVYIIRKEIGSRSLSGSAAMTVTVQENISLADFANQRKLNIAELMAINPGFTADKQLAKGMLITIPSEVTTSSRSKPIVIDSDAPRTASGEISAANSAFGRRGTASEKNFAMTAIAFVIDDEADIRELNKVALEMKGYKVFTAGTPAEARDIWRKNNLKDEPDVMLVIDTNRPKEEGRKEDKGLWIEEARAFRAEKKDLKILAISGAEVEQKWKEEGVEVEEFVSKPYSMKLLQDMANKVLPASQAMTAAFIHEGKIYIAPNEINERLDNFIIQLIKEDSRDPNAYGLLDSRDVFVQIGYVLNKAGLDKQGYDTLFNTISRKLQRMSMYGISGYAKEHAENTLENEVIQLIAKVQIEGGYSDVKIVLERLFKLPNFLENIIDKRKPLKVEELLNKEAMNQEVDDFVGAFLESPQGREWVDSLNIPSIIGTPIIIKALSDIFFTSGHQFFSPLKVTDQDIYSPKSRKRMSIVAFSMAFNNAPELTQSVSEENLQYAKSFYASYKYLFQVLAILYKKKIGELEEKCIKALGLIFQDLQEKPGSYQSIYIDKYSKEGLNDNELQKNVRRSFMSYSEDEVWREKDGLASLREKERLSLRYNVFNLPVDIQESLGKELKTRVHIFSRLDDLKNGGNLIISGENIQWLLREFQGRIRVSVNIQGELRKLELDNPEKSLNILSDGRILLTGEYKVFARNNFEDDMLVPVHEKLHLEQIQGIELHYLNDEAMISMKPVQALPRGNDKVTRGGIDLNAANLNLQIKRDGKGIPLPIAQQDWEHINIDGLIPVIMEIKPAINLPFFSELKSAAQTANG